MRQEAELSAQLKRLQEECERAEGHLDKATPRVREWQDEHQPLLRQLCALGCLPIPCHSVPLPLPVPGELRRN